jgi:hypothetical protein
MLDVSCNSFQPGLWRSLCCFVYRATPTSQKNDSSIDIDQIFLGARGPVVNVEEAARPARRVFTRWPKARRLRLAHGGVEVGRRGWLLKG